MPILEKINANALYVPIGVYLPPFYQSYADTYNAALIEDEAQSVLYIDGKPHESTSLVPFFDKKPEVFNPNKTSYLNFFQTETMFTKYGFANANHHNRSLVFGTTASFGQELTVGLTTNSKAADLTNTMTDSLLKQVEISGQKVSFYLTKVYTQNGTGSAYTYLSTQKIVMFLGDDFTNANSLAEHTFAIDSTGFTGTSNTFPTLTFLHIDTTNRYIYFLSHSRRQINTLTNIHECIYAIKFNLPAQDGSLSFGTPSKIYIRSTDNATGTGSSQEIEEGIISFCGYDASNNLIFSEQYNRAAAYPEVANKYVCRFLVVNYTTGAPTVRRTIQLQSTWNLNDSWNPGASASAICRPTKFLTDPNTPTLKKAVLPLPVSGTYNVGFATINWNTALNAETISNNPFTLTVVTQANTDPVGDYFDVTLNYTKENVFYFPWFQKPIITQLNNITYLTLFTTWKNYQVLDHALGINSKKANMVCYRVEDLHTTPKLRFVNSLPIEALDYILTDNDSTLNVIDKDGLSFYSLTPQGWVLTNKESGVFTSIAFDSFGRLFALKTSARDMTQWDSTGYMGITGTSTPYGQIYNPKLELHIIPRTSAYTTSIEFTDTDVEYNGVNINNTLKVNAYNALGQRILTTVLLSIEGPSMQFQAGGTQIQVTTSVDQDTSVPVVITGPGYVNVTASFVI